MGALTSLTLLLAGVEAGVAVDELADGVEAAAAVAGVHHRVLEQGGRNGVRMGGAGGDQLKKKASFLSRINSA